MSTITIKTAITFFITFFILLASNSLGNEVVYFEDFSDDPNLTMSYSPAQDEYFEWDSTAQIYKVRVVEEDGVMKHAYSPEFSLIENESFELCFDLKVAETSWGFSQGIYFFAPPATLGEMVFCDFYGSHKPQFTFRDGSETVYPNTEDAQTNIWYSIKIAYSYSAGTSHIQVKERASGSILFDSTGVEFNPVPFSMCAVGANTVNIDGYASEMHYDNIKVTRIDDNGCHSILWTGLGDTLDIEFPVAESEVPNSSYLGNMFVDTDSELGYHMGERSGALLPETQGQYIREAQASAWYRVLATNSYNPSLEYRYFAYDLTTGEVTEQFSINYQHQYVSSSDMGLLREWKYDSAMPINYQLGPNEVLGFKTILHTHGQTGVFYEYEYYYNSTQTPSYVDVWYSTDSSYNRYYVNDHCGGELSPGSDGENVILVGDSSFVSPLYESTHYLPIYLDNSDQIAAITLPLSYNWPFDPDSVSFEGCRTSYFERKIAVLDSIEKTLKLGLIADLSGTTPPLEPADSLSADSCIAKIYFTLPNDCDSSILFTETYCYSLQGDIICPMLSDVYGNSLEPVIATYPEGFSYNNYLYGDANNDNNRDVSDAVYMIPFIFNNGPEPLPICAGDANGDCNYDVSDPVYIINYVFQGGPAPKPHCSAPNLKRHVANSEIETIYSVDENSNSISININTLYDIKGVQLEFSSLGEVYNITSSHDINDMQKFEGQADGFYKLGLLDMNGQAYIPAGNNDVITISYEGSGTLDLVNAVLADSEGHTIPATINNRKGSSTVPETFTLDQNRPNPFNPTTEISYSLPEASDVKLDVYNIMGQKVTTLVDQYQDAGTHSVTWNSRDDNGHQVASGIYFYRLTADNYVETKKMILMK